MKVLIREQLNNHIRKFGTIYVLALMMALLIVASVIYTTMIPRHIYATVDGEDAVIVSKAHTVEAALEAAKLDYCDEDYLSVSPNAYVRDGMYIELVNAKEFTVTVDGKTKKYKTLKNTIGDALSEEGIKVGNIDIVEPSTNENLANNTNIVVKRVVKIKKTTYETLDYEKKEVKDDEIAEGKTEVTTKGVKGKSKVTYEITYIDGKKTSSKEISRKTVTKPVTEVVKVGTAVSYNGVLYKKKITVKAYSYTGGGRTASGTRARVGEIAVDPKVIPLGTTVYIPGVGERRAEDTGGNIKGNTIDIYMNSNAACKRWGRRTVTVYFKK